MTANTKMTEERAKKILAQDNHDCFGGCDSEWHEIEAEAKGFIEGYKAGREACENNHVIKTMNIYEDPMYKRGRAEMAEDRLKKYSPLMSYVRHRDNCRWKKKQICECGLKNHIARLSQRDGGTKK